jgi:uncharacterized protein YndB with AHSA1/START domain
MQTQKTGVQSITADPGKRDVVIISILNAPRALVFKTVTDPSFVPRWWGPKVYTTTVERMEVKPGGVWSFVQHGPDGKEYAFNGVYKKVDPPRMYAYTFNFEPMPGHEHLETLTFEEQNGKTKITNVVHFQSVEDRDGMLETGLRTGSIETMNRLSELLMEIQNKNPTSKTEGAKAEPIVFVRAFNAPRELIWKAWTEPARMMQWWGPRMFTSPFCKIDLRVGGKYLMSMRGPDGKDFWSTGVYREIVPFESIVLTDSFADEKGNIVPGTYYGMDASFPLEASITLKFEEQDGRTKFTLRYADMEGLADADRKNMMQGWEESFDKLEEYLKTLEVHAR